MKLLFIANVRPTRSIVDLFRECDIYAKVIDWLRNSGDILNWRKLRTTTCIRIARSRRRLREYPPRNEALVPNLRRHFRI